MYLYYYLLFKFNLSLNYTAKTSAKTQISISLVLCSVNNDVNMYSYRTYIGHTSKTTKYKNNIYMRLRERTYLNILPASIYIHICIKTTTHCHINEQSCLYTDNQNRDQNAIKEL